MPALLLLDGDVNFGRGLAIALRLDGIRVASAHDAAGALAFLDRSRFDLCVVDSLVGSADLVLARALAAGIPTIATGPHRELLDRARRRHGVTTLEKPFSPSALLAPLLDARRARAGGA